MEAVKHKTRYRFEQLANVSGAVHKLYVYDEVRAAGKFNWITWEYEESETSAKYFRDQLDAIPDGETIELHVNSAGGEVGEGVTIYNLLRQKANAGSRLVGYVDGMAYSVAMDIIMACDEIHMGLGTTMFLHNPWTYTSGNAEELRAMADHLDALAEASRQLYLSRSKNLTEEELKQMMLRETTLAPNACLEYGFCDFVGEGSASGEVGQETGAERATADQKAGVGRAVVNQEVGDGRAAGEQQAGASGDDPGGGKGGQESIVADRLKELRQQLYCQQQVNEMLMGLKKPSMQATFQAALKQLA